MIRLDHFRYEYTPFPIGVAQSAIEPSLYELLAASYPDREDFSPFRTDATGRVTKLSLSARTEPRRLARFLDRNPRWRELHEYLYSVEFTDAILDHLEEQGIQVVRKRPRGIARWIHLAAPALSHSRVPGLEKLAYHLPRKLGGISSKLEFSAIPGSDGGLRPHTDSHGKIVTLVLAFPREGEWHPDYGGGTSIVEPKDARLYFNRYNKTLDFEDVVVRRIVEYRPNQAMLFVKTFNSWHAVMPTTGPVEAWRKTLTVNLMTG